MCDLESNAAVTDISGLARMRCGDLAAIEVEDVQPVASETVAPVRTAGEVARTKPAPTRVKLVEPDAGLFALNSGCTGQAASSVKTTVCVPRRPTPLRREAADTNIVRNLPEATGVLDLTEVTEVQEIAAAELPGPRLAATEMKLEEPKRVIEAEPEDGLFEAR